VVILLFIGRLLWVSRSKGWDFIWWKNTIYQKFSLLVRRLMMRQHKDQFYQNLRYFFSTISFFAFVLLAISGVLPVIAFNERISGILLIIHVTIAPVFVVALAFTALFWANFKQFDDSDLRVIKKVKNNNKDQRPAYHLQTYWLKVFFWMFLAFSIPASLSIIFSMFPYFGTDGQNAMLAIHQYSTLVLLIIAFFYTDFKLITQTETNN
jgi:hypothetical protein